MRNIRLTLAYDGTNYVGWQIQPNGLSVQATVEHAIEQLTGETSKLTALTPEDIQESGDHEFLNWIITLGAIGEQPAKIVDFLDDQSQVSFKVFAIWD